MWEKVRRQRYEKGDWRKKELTREDEEIKV